MTWHVRLTFACEYIFAMFWMDIKRGWGTVFIQLKLFSCFSFVVALTAVRFGDREREIKKNPSTQRERDKKKNPSTAYKLQKKVSFSFSLTPCLFIYVFKIRLKAA